MIVFIGRVEASEQENWIRLFSSAIPDETILPFADLTEEQKQHCDIAIVANPDPQDLLALPNLKWIHSLWAGVERIMNELTFPSFSIVRLVDPELAQTMSEAVLSWTLYLHRDMPVYAKQQSKRTWLQQPMIRAQERRIGVLGLGALGKLSAKRLVDNGFPVAGWSRREKHIEGIHCFHGDEGLASLLKQSDILVCLLPLTPQTKGLLNHQTLSYLPTGASLINFARGPIIDDDALLKKLDEQLISHAVLDVFTQEPLAENHPYWVNDRVTVLPHISAPTHPISACEIVAKNISHYRLTGEMPVTVDPVQGY
ncbi:2-hydroxyacid dehydrogenase [Marinomonas ushuaiensis DSM 15871]|uniref:2-hydroxyacid dehydrogenase n=1 Tax=Marinomonas ushuaiensis DSM 15871 TaxID=1122207 RepID=X7E407_9GAMM|nr:glyoxylate/hydroxypyruvate reductase A [Marinomonas ushuaiensis]ETX10804.1 2-hydroxyacid dehydrogenase [Marinomonas ushuaiensis DSM 15871]